MSKKLYTVLGVSLKASEQEIKSAYRKLARKYHPDVNQNNKSADESFKEISSAYDILGNKEKREKYDNNEIDEEGKPKFSGGFEGFRGGGNQGSGGANFDFSSIFGEDIFSSFSGGQRGRTRGLKGQDVSYSLRISFLEAANGANKKLLINGKSMSVTIPAGTIDGQILRLQGLGYIGSYGGDNGDALINIKVSDHPYFSVYGNNILLDLPISLKEAILGAKVTIPTISGNVSVKIPPYSSSGEKLRLKGKGIKSKNGVGDEIVTLKITLPKEKNADLEDIIKNLKDEEVRNF